MSEKNINFIEVKSNLSWDEYFLLQAMITSFKSKDPSTKVGCVIVNKKNHQVGMGYNGMVSGIDESKLPWGKDKSVPIEYQKYGYVVHSESNAILHATKDLHGCKMYVTLFPCNECAKLIASKGIKEVIYLSDKHADKDSTRMSKKLFDLAGIKYSKLVPKKELLDHLNNYFMELMEQT